MRDQKEKENRLRPAADMLLNLVAIAAKGHATGVLLTGSGTDGAQGLLAMKKAGCMGRCQGQLLT